MQQTFVAIGSLITRSSAFLAYGPLKDLSITEGFLQNICKNRASARLARTDKLLQKYDVIDNYKVITGSFNWSRTADNTNGETLLVIH